MLRRMKWKDTSPCGKHWGKLEVAFLLIQKGAKVNVKEKYGRTPLHWASVHGNLEFATLLIQKGAKLDVKNKDGETPLHLVNKSLIGKLEVASLLIQKGAKVNVKEKYGRTPLHWASVHGNLEFATLLIQKGAKVNLKAKDGRTPLSIAKSKKTERLLNFFNLIEGQQAPNKKQHNFFSVFFNNQTLKY